MSTVTKAVTYVPATDITGADQLVDGFNDAFNVAYGWRGPVLHPTKEEAEKDYAKQIGGKPAAFFRVTVETVNEEGETE